MSAICLNATYETPPGYHGEIAPESVAFWRSPERLFLTQAIKALREQAKERGYKPASEKSIISAVAIAESLPENRALPRVAVDEDGDILMVWGRPNQKFALTIEGETIHMVLNPGQHSTHLDPVIYNGGHLPLPILRHVPLK